MMLGFTSKQLVGVGIFLFMIFIGVPLAIGVTGRWDFYFTLTSVALLAIASAGVWLTFYIGRINIGQGAFALIGAYVSAILVVKADWSFWISLPAAGLFSAVVAILIGLPILRLRGVYFAMITLVLTQVVTLTALALPITNGARGISNIPLPSGISVFGIPILPDFAAMENTKLAFGLKGGFTHYNLDQELLNDPSIVNDLYFNDVSNRWSPNIGLGMMLHTNKWYVGLSAPRVLNTDYNKGQNGKILQKLRV